MSKTKSSKTLTVRLSPELYSAAQDTARIKKISLNALLQESLAAAVRASEEQARYDGYTTLGRDAENCRMDYVETAQREVMLSE